MEVITGEKFKSVADFIFAPEKRGDGDYDGLQNTLNLNKLRDGNIIYTHTIYVKQLFELMNTTDKKYVLVSHNGDENINSTFKYGSNLLHWYTQNVDVRDGKIESLPIGLENDRWFKGVRKKEKMTNLLTQSKGYKNLCYMNFNVATNPSKRSVPYQVFQDKLWVTTDMKKNGEDFNEYLSNIYNHWFVICPEGNGIDTHRTWETLYMDSIPIEKRNINNQFYTDLPICFVNHWEEVTEDFLESEYHRIRSQQWNMDKLNFNYWKNKICRN
jgi:hypothetical protein